MRYLTTIFAILVVIIFIGCSYALSIKIIDDNPQKPVFSLTKNRQPVAVNRFDVFMTKGNYDDYSCYDYKNPVWSFTMPPGSGRKLLSVIYGVAPEGFKEVAQAKQLLPNVAYHASVLALGGQGGITFKISEDRSKVVTLSDK